MILYLYSMLVQGDRSVGSFSRFQLKNTLIWAVTFDLHYSTVLTCALFLSPLPSSLWFFYFNLHLNPHPTSHSIFFFLHLPHLPHVLIGWGWGMLIFLLFLFLLLHYQPPAPPPPPPTTSITLRGEPHHSSHLPLWIDLSISTSAPLRLYLSTCLTLLVALLSL